MPDWTRRRGDEIADSAREAVPEGAFIKCARCSAILYIKDFAADLKVCSKCGFHHRLTADERIAITADAGSWAEFDAATLKSEDFLEFPGYGEKLALFESRTDGLVTGTCSVGDNPCVLAISDFDAARLAGTMGSVFGEKFCRAADRAIAERSALVTFCASGGARMQEGLTSLMQMAKTSLAVAQLAQEKIPYIVVFTHPSTGGAVASYASLGDVIFSEPGATIGLSGERVSAQATAQKPPANFRTAEFALEHGLIDEVVARRDLTATIARTLAFFR
jgi:acetyl-CoA carboxylase carboxyl transferase subunit beta